MRNHLAALFGVWLGLAMPPAVFASIWSAEHDELARVEKSGRVQIAFIADVQTLSPTSDGGIWLTAANGLWSLSLDGEVRAHIDFVNRGFGGVLSTTADAYDGSVWTATDTALLLHFSMNGSLEHGTTLSAPAAALATDLDQSVWVITNGELVHFSSDGKWLETRSLHFAVDELAVALAIDALRGRVWIATTQGVYQLASRAESTASPVTSLRGETAALAIDPMSGIVLAIVDGVLVALDDAGKRLPAFDLRVEESEQPLALLHDASEAAFVVKTTQGILRVAHDGRLLERLPASASAIVGSTPFRIEPTVTLLRPPDGGAMTDPRAEIVLLVGATCNGIPCDVPQTYLQKARIDASLDGIPLGEGRTDATTGRATFPQRPAMAPGVNQLDARVVDAFGHQATLERARWTLVAPAAISIEMAATLPPGIATDSPITKAANKPPAVVLTSPAGGTTFSTGDSITLAATATDIDGSIAKVEFYRAGATLIGTATTAPYRYVWANAAAGSYSVTAKAYDNRNGIATSASVTISVTNNQLPAVTLTSPVGGSFVLAGSMVTLAASATDPDGTIASVEFFDAATPIGVAARAPYQLAWNPSLPGNHPISARATDNKGGTSQSVPVDIVVGQAPLVVVTSPAACSTMDGPLDVTLTADAMSAAGRIVSVDFFADGSLVGTASTAPWRASVINASAGSHSITANATDDHGLTTTSRPSTFTVRTSNQPPTVALTSPREGARFAFGSGVNLAATASDPDGSVAAVEFRLGSAGGSLIGRTTTPPYAVTWTNMAAGSYAVVAVAYDDRNATTTSAVVHVTIDANILPTIALTAPAPNASYAAPASIAITASASDSDGTITKVEFYAGASLIGSSNVAPYTLNWSNVGPGSYSMTAKAIDNAGGVATSAAVSITVIVNALPTVALTAPVPGGQYFAPATIALSANAADSDGTVARVDFYANGSLIGTSTAAPYGMVWDNIAGGAYSLTAKATDNAGGTMTSSVLGITVSGAPGINIDAALDGATIDDDNVIVRGFVSAPGNAAVTVNGVVTHIDDYGRFQANDVPLTPGSNTVTAVVTTQDGQTTSQSIAINSTGPGAFVVRASPTEGLNSLQVTFTVENPGNVPFKQINFDLDNDGFPNVIATPNQFTDGTLTVTATYPVGTWLATIKVYDDQDHAIYSTTKSIVVLQPILLQGNLLAIYDGMLSRLRAGNIPGALTAFTGAAYDKYNAIFTQLQPTLASIADQLGEVREVNFGIDLAEFSVVRNTLEGPKRFMFYLIRAEDGIWRIDGM